MNMNKIKTMLIGIFIFVLANNSFLLSIHAGTGMVFLYYIGALLPIVGIIVFLKGLFMKENIDYGNSDTTENEEEK